RSTQRELLQRRGRRSHTVLDLDYRPMFWPDIDTARSEIGWMLPHVTVAVGNRTEVEVATGTADPDEAAKRMLDHGVRLAIVKLGGDGVRLATADGSWTVPPRPVDVVCGLGAGDAFGGALAHGLLSGWEPERIGRYADAAGARVAGRRARADARPARGGDEAAACDCPAGNAPRCRGPGARSRGGPAGRAPARAPRGGVAARCCAPAGTRCCWSRPIPRPGARWPSAGSRWPWPIVARCWNGCSPRWPTPRWTACSPPRTWWKSCCCWTRCTTRS